MPSAPSATHVARHGAPKLRPAIDAFMVPESDRLFASKEMLDAAIPAVNGCFTARSLARMYARARGRRRDSTANGSSRSRPCDGPPRSRARGRDIVVGFPMRWRLGYHLAATTSGVIPNGFGHFGFGGSGAWADPDTDLAVAFVCNRVAGTPFGDTRFLRLGAAARAAARQR